MAVPYRTHSHHRINLTAKNTGISGAARRSANCATPRLVRTDRKAAAITRVTAWLRCSFQPRSNSPGDAEQLDLTHAETTTWRFATISSWQLTPDWRLDRQAGPLGQLIARSAILCGGYTEGVVGYAYRPVRNDRLNALV